MRAGKIKKLNINFSFILLFLWFVFSNNIKGFVLFIFALLIHEFGHAVTAKKLGYQLKKCSVTAYGVCLSYQEKNFHPKDEIFIAIAGPIANFIFAIFCICLWWIIPDFYNFSHSFVRQSLFLGLFNLLPCYPMDGGRVFVGIFNEVFSRKKAIKITFLINIFVSIVFFLFFIISCFINFNPSLCACGVFMIISAFENKKECYFQQINVFTKKVKNFSKPTFVVVNSNQTIMQLVKHVEINRFTIFLVVFDDHCMILDEKKLQALAVKFPLSSEVEKILIQEKE